MSLVVLACLLMGFVEGIVIILRGQFVSKQDSTYGHEYQRNVFFGIFVDNDNGQET